MRMCETFRDMYLVRRSLGRNGCGVKQRNDRIAKLYIAISLRPDWL